MQTGPFTIEDEIRFWGARVREHMIFIHLGLVTQAIEDNNIPKKTIHGKSYNLREEATILKNLWTQLLEKSNINIENVKELITNTMTYQEQVQTYIFNGVWIGWLSYSFMGHIIEELRYFWSKITGGGYNLEDEINFWLWHDDTEAAATVKLIDPSQIDLANQINGYINSTKVLRKDLLEFQTDDKIKIEGLDDEALGLFNGFKEFIQYLRKGIDNKEILNNIPYLLIEHIDKEAERSLQIMNWLLKNKK